MASREPSGAPAGLPIDDSPNTNVTRSSASPSVMTTSVRRSDGSRPLSAETSQAVAAVLGAVGGAGVAVGAVVGAAVDGAAVAVGAEVGARGDAAGAVDPHAVASSTDASSVATRRPV